MANDKSALSDDVVFGGGSQAAIATATAPTLESSSDESIFNSATNKRAAADASVFGTDSSIPVQSPDKHPTPDPNMPWYERAWDWANTPLVNFNPENESGVWGGTKDVASGLTSPLSIGLTIATLGGGALLRGLGIAAEELPVAAKGLKTLVDAGFTAQGALQAAKESPRVLDALREGDYETAKRLAVHVLAGGGLAYLGGRQTIKDAGVYFPDVPAKLGFKVKPTEENLKVRDNIGVYQADVAENAQNAKLLTDSWHKEYKDLSPIDREGTMYLMQAGGSKATLIARHNLLAEAAGRPEEKIPVEIKPTVDPTVATGGTGALSAEELARNDVFIKYDKSGNPTYLGKQPDASLKEGEAILAVNKINGKARVQNTSGLADSDAMAKFAEHAEKNYGRNLSSEEYATKAGVPGLEEPEREARYSELAAEKNIKEKYTPEEITKLLSAYKSAINATPKMYELASKAKDTFSVQLEKAQAAGVIGESTVDNYITHLWEKEADNEAANQLIHEARSGAFRTNVSMARKRIFENAFEGQLLGRKLSEPGTDPIAIVGNYINKIGESVAAREFIDRLRDKGLRASDGRPMVALSGSGSLIEGEEGNPAILANPNTIRSVRISDKVINLIKQHGFLDKFIEDGAIVELKNKEGEPSYGWNTHDYRNIDHPAMRGWNYAASAPDGTPTLIKAEMRVHPEAYEYLNRFLGTEPSIIKSSKPLKALQDIGGEAKHLTLSLSPFHVAQEGLRALMTGISPFGVEKWNLAEDALLRKGVEQSLTLGKEHRSIQDYQEGAFGNANSKILQKIPVLKNVQNYLQEFLFDRYIPGLKARAFKSLYERYKNANPEWSPTQVARIAAEDTNERFGGINYKQLGRSASTQDFLRLTTLAPDWLESELRFAKRVFTPGPEGSVARADVVKMTAALWGVSRILNLVTNGKPHLEAPFGVAVTDNEGKEKIYSIRTLPTDIMHAVSDPADFLRGRISPLGRIATQAYTGRDYRGRKLTPFENFVEMARGVTPIPVQTAVGKAMGQNPDLTSLDQTVKAVGGTAQVYRSPAQQKAAQIASEKSESGPVDPVVLRKHHAVIEFEDRLRAGEMPITEIHDMVEKGTLPVKDAKEIVKNVKETQGLDPEMARLHSRASRLPMRDFLQVWDLADNNEKVALTKLLLKKKAAYFKKSAEDMTPQERQQDPTYQRLRKLFPVDQNF